MIVSVPQSTHTTQSSVSAATDVPTPTLGCDLLVGEIDYRSGCLEQRRRLARDDEQGNGKRADDNFCAQCDHQQRQQYTIAGRLFAVPPLLGLFAVERLYILGRIADRADMASVRVHMLSQGGGIGTERSQAEGAEGRATGQAGVRGNVHDRGQGLGGRAYLGTNHHRSNPGKLASSCLPPIIS